MAREIPEVVRAAAGLAATLFDEASKLPETLPGLPVRVIGKAMQHAMRIQQQYASLVARGDELFTGLRGEDEPGLATFDDEEPAPTGFRDSAFDRAGETFVSETVIDVELAEVEEIAEQLEGAQQSLDVLAEVAPSTEEILDEIAIDELVDQAPTLEESAPVAPSPAKAEKAAAKLAKAAKTPKPAKAAKPRKSAKAGAGAGTAPEETVAEEAALLEAALAAPGTSDAAAPATTAPATTAPAATSPAIAEPTADVAITADVLTAAGDEAETSAATTATADVLTAAGDEAETPTATTATAAAEGAAAPGTGESAPAADSAAPAGAATATDESGTPVAAAPTPATTADDASTGGTGATTTPANAPVDGYDAFTVAQLRGRLRGYALSTVEELVSYEKATRNRAPYLTMLRNRLEKLEEQAVDSSPLAPRGA